MVAWHHGALFKNPNKMGTNNSSNRRRWCHGEVRRVCVMPELPPRARNHFPGYSIHGLVLSTILYGGFQVLAFAATGPVGDIETEIRPTIAGPTLGATMLNKPTVGRPTGNPLWAIPLDSLSYTRERPLFSPSRRPPSPAPVVVAAPAASPVQTPPKPPDHPPLTLVGTVIGASQSIGIFVDQVTNNVVRLRAGEGRGGWMLRAIRGREAIFENDQREVTLALPARNGMEQAAARLPSAPRTATGPADAPVGGDGRSASPSLPSLQATGKPANVPPSMWLDGDGQIINPPPLPAKYAAQKPGAAPPSTWLDGDGQSISAPPKPRMTPDGKPLGPPVWLDGYGRPIGPAPTAWLDGDGQSTEPPPYRWMDQDGNPIVPPPPTWQDGDGQYISAPLTRIRQSAHH